MFTGENGYTVGLFKVLETDPENADFVGRTITFTGYFHELNELDTYILRGNFVIHPKYGEQFSTESYERCKPEEKDAIVEFLASGLFKGLGEKKAQKIVDVLGKETLNIILENPDNLLLVPSITKKQADLIHDTLENYESSYQTLIELNDLGFTTRESMIIYNRYRSLTSNVISNNLYQICDEINDITFKKIDSIALKHDYERDDTRRVKSGILYTMDELCNLSGDVYLKINEIYTYTNRLLKLEIEKEQFVKTLEELIKDGKLVNEEERFYLKDLYDDEDYVVRRIKYLVNKKGYTKEEQKKLLTKINKKIAASETELDIAYNDDQLKAIRSSFLNDILIITGGPGTGKTTIIKAIIDLYQDMNKLKFEELVEKIALLAPTGRASKRLSEKAICPSSTIHRFLKWNKDTNAFQINEFNRSKKELVIIDESSMIDLKLFASLLKGLKTDTKLIIVGDYNQLPSVGVGQVLKDLIESEVVNSVKLRQLYRQKEGSNIINLAYEFNDGKLDKTIFNKGSDLTLYEESDEKVLKRIEKLCNSYKKADYKDFQILVPMYKTLNGIDNINKIAQEIFNPHDKNKKEIKIGDIIYREHDKVLQLSNMPEENIFNGDIGIIHSIDKKEIIIDFDGNLVKFTPSNFSKFKHGYAISIHKSQGSEFKTVIIPVVSGYSKMLYRKLYYTGITRSKKELFIVGDYNALLRASLNNESDSRRTTLKDKLIKRVKGRKDNE